MINKTSTPLTLVALALASALFGAAPATAQVAGGSTTLGVSVTESTQIARGWSVKRTLLGKTVYNEAGTKVGNVEDLIIAPDRNVSYVIVGAGGFVGIGRHDVAIPVSQIQERAGKLVMPSATKDTIKALPAFDYAIDNTQRDKFVAAAEKDIAAGRAKVTDLEKKTATAATEAKVKLDKQLTDLRADVKSAEGKLSDMKEATAARWKEFESSVSAATARLRKSLENATG